jgi:hypothetical protein
MKEKKLGRHQETSRPCRLEAPCRRHGAHQGALGPPAALPWSLRCRSRGPEARRRHRRRHEDVAALPRLRQAKDAGDVTGTKWCCPNQQRRRKKLKPSHRCHISGVPRRTRSITSSAARDLPAFAVLESSRAPPSARLHHADVALCCHLLPSVRTHGHPCHVVAAKSTTSLLIRCRDEAEDGPPPARRPARESKILSMRKNSKP